MGALGGRRRAAAHVAALALAVGALPAGGGSSLAAVRADLGEPAAADLAESSAAMLAAVAALREAERSLPAARAAAAAAGRRAGQARARYRRAARGLAVAQTALLLAAGRAEAADERAGRERARLARFARAAYMRGPADLSLLLGAGSADPAAPVIVVERVLAAQRRAADEAAAATVAAEADRADLEARRRGQALARERAGTVLARLRAEEAAAGGALARVRYLAAARRRALAAARAAEAEDAARHAALRAEANALARRLGAGAGWPAGDPVTPVPGLFVPPVPGPVTSPFGMRVHPVTGVYKLHTGTDFGVPCGTPVPAAGAGTVLESRYHPAYGNRVVVTHGPVGPRGVPAVTTYSHLERRGVAVGDPVAAGQPVGLVGTTGFSTGCHLHLELLLAGSYVDPVPWLA